MTPKDILKTVADNPNLTEELKSLFGRFFAVEAISLEGNNEEIGEKVRVRLEGQKLLAAAFKELEKYKTPEARKNGVADFR